MPEAENIPDFDEALALVPLRCRVCKYGQSMLGLAWAWDATTGAFGPTVEAMREACGDDEPVADFDIRDPDTEAGIIDAEAGPTLFMPLDDGKDCPYRDSLAS